MPRGHARQGWCVIDRSNRQLSYERYNGLGQRTRVSLSDGSDRRTTNYAFDHLSRLKTITSTAGAFGFGYDSQSRSKSLTYSNGITTVYDYDGQSRLTSIRHVAGTTAIAFANYSGFDKVGNRQSGPGAKDTQYQYNAGNQMTRGRQYGYTYDDAGNQAARTLPNSPDKGWVQSWDLENRLVKMERSKGAEKKTIVFTYDPLGRRIGKQLTTITDGVTKNSNWTYVYDDDNIVLEIYTNETGTTEKSWYTHGPGTDEHLGLERNGSKYYYHADGLGSITTITDANKNVVQAYDYDSFGVPKTSTSFRNGYTSEV